MKRILVVAGVISLYVGSAAALCSDRESLRAIITEIRDSIAGLENEECGVDFSIKQEDVPFVITESGTYCVAENLFLAGAGAAMITVQADNVVINLNGHTLDCGNGDRDGIDGAGVSNVHIFNGTIQNSASDEGAGIYFTESKGLQFSQCVVRKCSVGFFLDKTIESSFNDCIASENDVLNQPGIGFLIQESPHNSLTACKAQSNAGDGFLYTNAIVRAGCKNTISTNCVAQSNGGSGFKVEEANHNVFVDCVSHMNDLNGFLILDGSYNVLRTCVASRNAMNGILVTIASVEAVSCNVIRECEFIENGSSGIQLVGSPVISNQIIGCAVSCNGFIGVISNSEDNVIVNNCSQSNGSGDYSGVTQPIVAVGSMDATTSFWTNLAGSVA